MSKRTAKFQKFVLSRICHTGYSDDLDFVFAHVDQVCSPFSKRTHDPDAPYDGFDESDDTEERAKRSRREVGIK